MLRSLAWCVAAVATASLAHAQTATETVNLGTRTVEGAARSTCSESVPALMVIR